MASASRHLLSQLPAVPELLLAEVTGATAPDLTLATAAVDAVGVDVLGATPAAAEITGAAAADLQEGEDYPEEEDGQDKADLTAATTSGFYSAADLAEEDDEIQLAGLQAVGADDWFPNPLPEWSYNCMPW
jgi:hypothetical protein